MVQSIKLQFSDIYKLSSNTKTEISNLIPYVHDSRRRIFLLLLFFLSLFTQLSCAPVAAPQHSTDQHSSVTTSLYNGPTTIASASTGLGSTQQYFTTTQINNITNGLVYDNSKILTTIQSNSRLPKKFTITAGNLWKFTKIKDYFPYRKEAEFRLYRNVSNRFVIDDDFWFQYDHQQPQLFAWPSLSTKPGTYYFILVPSGLDLEADDENSLNPDVVVYIVVELIKPLYGASTSRINIDQLIDHTFSLENLHRASNYPLLLHQIVAIFNSLSRANNHISKSYITKRILNLPTTTQSISTTTTSTSTSIPTSFQRNLKVNSKINDYTLISYSYSSDGEYFSLTWTTQLPDNASNIASECRYNSINETISKFSSTTLAFHDERVEDKFVVYYRIDPSILATNSIIPTRRGNFAIKLVLRGACQHDDILDRLTAHSNSLTSNISEEIDDIGIVQREKGLRKALIGLPSPEPIDSTTASTTASSATTTNSNLITNTQITRSSEVADTSSDIRRTKNQQDIIRRSESTESPVTQTMASLSKVTTTAIPTRPFPQAKSFESYLDMTESPRVNISTTTINSNISLSTTNVTMEGPSSSSTSIPVVTPIYPTSLYPFDSSSIDLNTPILTENYSSTLSSANLQPVDASLTDDFLDILSDVAERLVSVAIPASILIGTLLLISIVYALCSLHRKRKKTRQLGVGDRFSFRYSSERRAFLKSGSKPVIMDADQKSLSAGNTPTRKPNAGSQKHGHKHSNSIEKGDIVYLAMQPISKPK